MTQFFEQRWTAKTRFLPIITIRDSAHAVPLANALMEGGVDAVEFTLRTTGALSAIEAVAKAVPQLQVGAGTVVSLDDFERAHNAGATFFVSPGFDPILVPWPHARQRLWLPGVQTASEVMVARRHGFTRLKFFPAEAAGGVTALQALAPVFADVQFFPTGGITREKLASYAALPCVGGVGGSWIAPEKLMVAGDWAGITALAKVARSNTP